MNEIYKFYKGIETRKDFEHFLKLFYAMYKEDTSKGQIWENSTLEEFLRALYYSNLNTTEEQNSKQASWKEFAIILLTAVVYE